MGYTQEHQVQRNSCGCVRVLRYGSNKGFEFYDLDGDGIIDADEFRYIKAAEFEFEKIDKNNDGKISRPEWIIRYGSDVGFDEYDTDGDGLIDADEFRKMRLAKSAESNTVVVVEFNLTEELLEVLACCSMPPCLSVPSVCAPLCLSSSCSPLCLSSSCSPPAVRLLLRLFAFPPSGCLLDLYVSLLYMSPPCLLPWLLLLNTSLFSFFLYLNP